MWHKLWRAYHKFWIDQHAAGMKQTEHVLYHFNRLNRHEGKYKQHTLKLTGRA